MMKKSLLMLVLVLSLPSCGKKSKKSDNLKNSKKMAFSNVNMPLADGDDVANADESVRSLFERDMDQFVAFADDADNYSLMNEGDVAKGLEVVYFDFDKHSVRADQEVKVKHNAVKAGKLLADAKAAGTESNVLVEGHACASAGSRVYNLALSEKRAKECADHLISSGVPADHVKTVGRGQEMLVVKTGSREEQAPNRRAELHIIAATA
jgi:outer membrane protein OmpA-like peptidoglycan-associated protein